MKGMTKTCSDTQSCESGLETCALPTFKDTSKRLITIQTKKYGAMKSFVFIGNGDYLLSTGKLNILKINDF